MSNQRMCPSAQPDMEHCQVLGVLSTGERGNTEEEPRLAYLNQTVPVTPEILAMAAPAKPTQVFRFAANCEESKCTHFDGHDCQLAKRIVQIMPAVVSALPACIIRANCRWYGQEGGSACLRCPQVATYNTHASETLQTVAGPEARVSA